MVKSELQLAVLRFCRDAWKYVYKLEEPARSQMASFVRTEFEKYKTLPRIKFHQIEYRLRSGKNKLQMIQQCGKIDSISWK